MSDLAGRRVVVLGGSSGIGLAVARAAQAAGGAVVIAARTPATLEAAAAALGGTVETHAVDARSEAALAALFAQLGRFDHLVVTTSDSSSRHGVNQPLASIELDAAHAFFEGKYWNQVRAAKAALPHLAEEGAIVLTSGVASRRTLANHTLIGSVNSAIEGFARQLAREIGPRRVVVVAPGMTRTRAYDPLGPDKKAEMFARVGALLPVGRVGTPEAVARAYLFALTADYLTGTVIDIDGGHLVA